MKILCRKTLSGHLCPIDDAGKEALAKFKSGTVIRAQITKPRNVYFHRKFFAMLSLIMQNQEHYKSVDDLLDVCKLRIGHVRVIQTACGEERVPQSISFAAMDEIAFQEFYDRAVDWMIKEVIPGLRKLDLNHEVEAELMQFAA